MRRAQKKKVTAVQPASKATSSSTIDEPPPPSPPKEVKRLPQPPSPGKQLRVQAGLELKEDRKLLKWAEQELRAAEQKFKGERAAFDAKMESLEKRQAKLDKMKLKGTAVERAKEADAVLEGVNKADRRLLLAASTLHEAQLDAACMRIAVQAAQIRLLELHVARFKRLRRVQRRR